MEAHRLVTPPGLAATSSGAWTKSSFCGEASCVEVAVAQQAVGVRDSKIADSPVLSFTRDEWTAFVAGVKNGEFDPI